MSEPREDTGAAAPPAEAPAEATPSSAAPVEPIAEAAPGSDAPAVEAPAAAPAEPAAEASPAPAEELLSGADPNTTAAPREAPAVEATTAPSPEAFQYQPFTVPEGLPPLDQERVTELTGILDDAALDRQSRAQRLIDLHVAEMRRYDEGALQRQMQTFVDVTQAGWRNEAAADPEIGGAGARTSLIRANAAIRRFTSDEHRQGQRLAAAREGEARQSDRSAFIDMLRVTGAINHPEMVRFLARVENALREPARAAEAVMPPKDIGRRPANAGRPDRSVLYDHESSQRLMNGA